MISFRPTSHTHSGMSGQAKRQTNEWPQDAESISTLRAHNHVQGRNSSVAHGERMSYKQEDPTSTKPNGKDSRGAKKNKSIRSTKRCSNAKALRSSKREIRATPGASSREFSKLRSSWNSGVTSPDPLAAFDSHATNTLSVDRQSKSRVQILKDSQILPENTQAERTARRIFLWGFVAALIMVVLMGFVLGMQNGEREYQQNGNDNNSNTTRTAATVVVPPVLEDLFVHDNSTAEP